MWTELKPPPVDIFGEMYMYDLSLEVLNAMEILKEGEEVAKFISKDGNDGDAPKPFEDWALNKTVTDDS